MKWLLITTLGKNVGDEFVRIGIQNVIREVDPAAEFELLCKETDGIHKPRPFDRAVICGMPLFWSLPYNEASNIDWWDPIFRGWVSDDPRKLAAVGVGSVIVGKIQTPTRYIEDIAEAVCRTHFLSVRQPVLDHPQIIDTICPASFAVHQGAPRRLLCNFMPHGGHHYCTDTQNEDLTAWKQTVPGLAKRLIAEGYEFVAHNPLEALDAFQLGFPVERVHFFNGPEGYIKLYGEASCYIGNRLHGAVLVAAAGRPVLGIAADNRVKMVRRLGGATISPRDLTSVWKDINPFQVPSSYFIPAERAKLRALLRDFMGK